MARFRKKPVEIEAVQYKLCEWADSPFLFSETPPWLFEAIDNGIIEPEFRSEDYWYLIIKTLEGEMTVSPDDWIIQGVQGELYPCKPDIFQETYEPVE